MPPPGWPEVLPRRPLDREGAPGVLGRRRQHQRYFVAAGLRRVGGPAERGPQVVPGVDNPFAAALGLAAAADLRGAGRQIDFVAALDVVPSVGAACA